jgi:hypothetical protein
MPALRRGRTFAFARRRRMEWPTRESVLINEAGLTISAFRDPHAASFAPSAVPGAGPDRLHQHRSFDPAPRPSDYADALGDAAKRETRLNIVKLRYADTPSLVTVSQLVSGYTLEGRLDLRSDFFTNTFDFADDLGFGVGGTFSDRPTVT